MVARLLGSPRFRIRNSTGLRPCGFRRTGSHACLVRRSSCAAHRLAPRLSGGGRSGLLRTHGIEIDFEDRRELARRWRSFLGRCAKSRRPLRCAAVHDSGVLAATTAFGKTVVAAALIAQRGVSTWCSCTAASC